MKMRISSPFRLLCSLALLALLTVQFAAAQSPREHLSLDAGWKFHLGYMSDKQENLKKVADAFGITGTTTTSKK